MYKVYKSGMLLPSLKVKVTYEHLKVVRGWWWVYLDYSVISGLFVSCQLSWTVKKEIEMRPLIGD